MWLYDVPQGLMVGPLLFYWNICDFFYWYEFRYCKLWVILWKINPFSTSVSLLYPLKTWENWRFSDVLRGGGGGGCISRKFVENELIDNMELTIRKIFDWFKYNSLKANATKWHFFFYPINLITSINCDYYLHKYQWSYHQK